MNDDSTARLGPSQDMVNEVWDAIDGRDEDDGEDDEAMSDEEKVRRMFIVFVGPPIITITTGMKLEPVANDWNGVVTVVADLRAKP